MFEQHEELLVSFLDSCQRHENAVQDLINHARNERHEEFKVTQRLTRKLADEADDAYRALTKWKLSIRTES